MTRWLVAASLVLTALACTGGPSGDVTDVTADAPAPERVSAHTEGFISRRDPIVVRFVADVASADSVGQPAPGLWAFEPPLEGEATWTSARELRFQPKGELTSGAHYVATVDAARLSPDWKGEDFGFEFDVIPQSFSHSLGALEAQTDAGDVQRLTGTVSTADVADADAVARMVTAKLGDAALTPKWSPSTNGREWRFTVEGVQRQEQAADLNISFAGAPLGLTGESTETVKVPSLGDFGLTSIQAVAGAERHLKLVFTDPLDPRQDLNGLIRVQGQSRMRFDIDRNVVTVFPVGSWPNGQLNVSVAKVKNAARRALPELVERTITFDPMVPEVRFAGKGVIFPTSQQLTVPIETVNLHSVRVQVQEVFDSNVPQFLQVNDLDGSEQLHRVGRTVWSRRVAIPTNADRANDWMHLGLDLSDLVATHPAGLYRIQVDFDRSDVDYSCPNAAPAPTPVVPPEEDWDKQSSDDSYWDNYEDGEVPYWELRENRKNPCHPGFYKEFYDHDVKASRNVIVSDVGLTAKRGADDLVLAVATDLRTGDVLAGAQVELLDYQLQVLSSGVSDAQGFAQLAAPRKPFALVASANGQTSWLKLAQGSALSVAHFDVSGAAVADGLKGYVYGERGVWRPGDDIPLTFVLFDEQDRIPADHPVQFELRDPRGALVESRVIRNGKDGFYAIPTRTKADAPTGSYQVAVKVGGSTFGKTLRVEMITPNRLKIELPFAAERLPMRDGSPRLTSTLQARWLHGAPAPGLDAQVEVSLAKSATRFDRWADFSFDDPTRTLEDEPHEVFSGALDSTGAAQIDVPIDVPREAPGMLTATVRTRVFEPGGGASVDEAQVQVSPHPRYIGVKLPKGDVARGMLLTDTKHPVEIVAVNADGEPAGDGTVHVGLYKISWRWWWEKGPENLGDFAAGKSREVVAEGDVSLKGGKGAWSFEVKYPAWGRYLLVATDKAGTHQSARVVYLDWPGWAGRAQKDGAGGAAVLSVTAASDHVNVGEPITLNIPTAQKGRVLVSLETGSRVLDMAWVTPTGDTTAYTFTATAAMSPTVYANVTLLQPYDASGNDRPVRLYGVVPIAVEDPASRLHPELTTADTFAPNDDAVVNVRETDGKPMTYTLAVVDEGLLGLTRFQTPDPWGTFNAREALGVRTWDIFGDVAGAYGRALEGTLAIGGDGEADAPSAKAQRFKPVATVLGPFHLDADQKATHKVPLGQYLGEVRVMVVAGDGAAYGSAQRSVPVKTPLMVLASLPRVLGPQEQVALPVSVFTTEDGQRDVTVSVAIEGPGHVVGPAQQEVHLKGAGDALVPFQLALDDTLGVVRVKVTAKSARLSSEQVVEVDVRYPGTRATQVIGSTLLAGATWDAPAFTAGLPGTNDQVIEVSAVPPLDLGRRLDQLIAYPHGCVEQTTSGSFPQLYLSRLLDLSPSQQQATQKNVQAAVERLASFQTTNGGLGYWPGETTVSTWGTNYAGHFLVEAERAGYVLPPGMLGRWKAFQSQEASRWSRSSDTNSDLEQAYRLYTLALAGSPQLAAMNRLREAQLSVAARWRLAAAYQLAGQESVARELIAGPRPDLPHYQELSGTFGSDRRDRAMMLETLALLGDAQASADFARQVSTALTSEATLSTQEIAYSLVAMARYGETTKLSDPATLKVQREGGKATTLKLDHALAQDRSFVGQDTLPAVHFTNTSGVTLFPRVIASSLPRVAEEQASTNGLAVSVAWALTGNGEAVDPTSVAQGTDLTATVKVHNITGRALEQLALMQLLPSGWEVNGEAPGPGEGYVYRDVRDDRVSTYFDLKKDETRTFEIRLHASYEGRFYLPPTSVQAMYDPTINGRTRGAWVQVVRPGPEG